MTAGFLHLNVINDVRQKAPSAKRCIRTVSIWETSTRWFCMSESTERQKVH